MRHSSGGLALAEQKDLGRIKGTTLREFLVWYEGKHGSEALCQAALRLPEPMHQSLRFDQQALGILGGSWYDAALIHALLDAMTGELYPEERRKMAQEAAEAVLQSTLRGIYRILFNLMITPERYARHGPRLWKMYYDGGAMAISSPDPNTAVSRVRDWPSHHPFICELNREASPVIYREMGCTGVAVRREACVGDGDPECRFVTSWTGGA